MTKEYLLLFGAITDAIAQLEQLRRQLMEAQCAAEEAYISAGDQPATSHASGSASAS